MSESVLLNFIDTVTPDYVDYCVICLRTSMERRLEKPKHLKTFMQSTWTSKNETYEFNEPYQLVCFVCERQAAAALRFRTAVSSATLTHSMIQQLQKYPQLKNEFYNAFHNQNKPKSWPKTNRYNHKFLKNVLDCEVQTRRQRVRSQLLNTEVLTVSTPSAIANFQPESGPGESRDMYVLPDDVPHEGVNDTINNQKQESEIKMESIVIFDDDPVYIKTEEVETTTEPAENTEPVLLSTLSQQTDQPKPTNFFLHPIIFNSGMMTVPSLSANIINGKLVSLGPSNVVVETPQIALQNGGNIDFIIDPCQVTNVLKKLSHQDATKVHIFTTTKPVIGNFLPNYHSASNSDIVISDNVNSATLSVPVNTNIKQKKLSHSQTILVDNLNREPSFGEPRILGEPRSLGEPQILGQPRSLAEPQMLVQPRSLGEPQILVQPRSLGEPQILVQPRSLGEPRILGEPRSLAEPQILGEPRSLGEPQILVQPRSLGEPRILGEPRSLAEPQILGEPRSLGEPQILVEPQSQSNKNRSGLRSDRIDWEDKIPMDVISFMDADENTHKRPRLANELPALGISNVTSLSETTDVIDLC